MTNETVPHVAQTYFSMNTTLISSTRCRQSHLLHLLPRHLLQRLGHPNSTITFFCTYKSGSGTKLFPLGISLYLTLSGHNKRTHHREGLTEIERQPQVTASSRVMADLVPLNNNPYDGDEAEAVAAEEGGAGGGHGGVGFRGRRRRGPAAATNGCASESIGGSASRRTGPVPGESR